MFLKNYTSDVPVSRTLDRIEKVLIRCGVARISKDYGANGEVIAVQFVIQPGDGAPEMTVRLPADKEKALNALWLDYVDGDTLDKTGDRLMYSYSQRKKKSKKDFTEQAERTAWKIIQDWVEVQMSMIQLNQAEYREVFMPYIWDGKNTIFQKVKANGYRAMLPEKCEVPER